MRYLLPVLIASSMVSMAMADVHRYEVTQSPSQVLAPIELPAEIVGSLSAANASQAIGFQVYAEPQSAAAAIYTFSGTGAVFSATLSKIHEGSEEARFSLSGSGENVDVDDSSVYQLNITASAFRSGARYVVRLGSFDALAVAFDGNGGTVHTNRMDYTPGSAYGSFPTAERVGHDFTGWATAATNGIVLATNTVVCVGYTNLYAQWSQAAPTNTPPEVITNYVSFIANGGVGNMATQTFIFGEAQALSSNLFTRETYDFAGWATSATGLVAYADGAVASNLSSVAGATVPLYAKWTRMTNVYDVAFNANGGQGTMGSQTFSLGEPQPLATNLFTRGGYDFKGWATSATGAVVYADCQIVTNVATNAGVTVSLYAAWAVTPLPIQSATINGVTWHYAATNGTATIMNRVGTELVTAVSPTNVSSLAVPETISAGTNAYTVVGIGENAFKGCASLTNVVVPATVTDIGANAFSGCGRIESATIPLAMPLFSVLPDSYRRIKRVTVPGIDEFLDDEISVCELAFSNCTSLAYVSLPLGVTELPVNCFAGCTSLTSFEMPYTVTSIGDGAFSGCTGLVSLTVTENVAEIGANAFSGCSSLKIVRYLGDEPEAATGGTGNIYYHANKSLVSGYLSGLRSWDSAGSWEESEEAVSSGSSSEGDEETGTSSSTTVTTHTYTPAIWPEGGAGRPLKAWNNSVYQFRTVTLDYNDGGKTAAQKRVYVVGRVVGELPDPDDGSTGSVFEGWFTERYGGTEVDPYTVVNAAMTVYAHWSGDDSGNGMRGVVDAFESLYDDDAGFSFAAAVFDGWLMDGDVVAGTIQVKTRKGKYVASAEGSNSTFTAAMQVVGSSRASLSGTIGPDGTAEVENERKGLALSLEFTQFGLSGSYSTEDGEYTILAARDRYSAGSAAAKAAVRAALGRAGAGWSIVLPTADAEGDGADLANGYSVLSVTIGAKGKATVKGVMADGSKVSVSSKLIVGDGCCCLPVVVPLYAKRGGFSFALWFSWPEDGGETQASVAGLSSWDASQSKSAPFTAAFGEAAMSAVGALADLGEATFQMDGFFDIDGADDSFSPDGTEVDATRSRWVLPKADGVRFVRDEGWQVQEGKDYGNPAGLKLSYAAKTGMFTGSFKVFAETAEGKSNRYTATVTGMVVDGVGYGTATVKKTGSLPVMIE